MFVFREQGKPFLQEDNELVRHLIQLVKIAIRVDVAEARTDWIVDEHNICEFIPGSVVVLQCVVVLQAIRADFHQGAILGTTAGAAIQPDDRPLLIRDVLVLEVPEEHVAIVFGGDLDMPNDRDRC